MQIVIDIPEVFYEALKKTDEILGGQRSGKTLMSVIYNAVAKGIPLPKGHGALKDSEKLYADVRKMEELARQRVIDTPSNSPCYMRYVAQLNERTAFKEMIYDAQTIIEADKAESEDKE